MAALFLADERAEHEFFMQGDALCPLVYCGNGDAEPLADFRDGFRPLEVRDQDGEDKEQAVSAIRYDDVGQNGMGRLAGPAVVAVNLDCGVYDLAALVGCQPPAIAAMSCKFPDRAAFGARLNKMVKTVRRFSNPLTFGYFFQI